MKGFLRNLAIIGFFFMPAYGHSSSPASPAPAAAPTLNSEAPVEPAPVAAPAEAEDEGMQFPVIRTIGGMGLVVFLMLAVFFCAKKFAPRYFHKTSSERNLKILETLSMGDRRSVSLIEVGNSRFLVGNTPHQINLLAALPEPLSLVSEPEAVSASTGNANKKEARVPFRNIFEVEKNRPARYAADPLPEDLRTKMRQLRDALERS